MGKPTPSPDDVLSTAEAAELLDLSTRQVREHAEAGRLKGQKLNPRTWVFRRADVEGFTPRPRGRPKDKPAAKRTRKKPT